MAWFLTRKSPLKARPPEWVRLSPLSVSFVSTIFIYLSWCYGFYFCILMRSNSKLGVLKDHVCFLLCVLPDYLSNGGGWIAPPKSMENVGVWPQSMLKRKLFAKT